MRENSRLILVPSLLINNTTQIARTTSLVIIDTQAKIIEIETTTRITTSPATITIIITTIWILRSYALYIRS